MYKLILQTIHCSTKHKITLSLAAMKISHTEKQMYKLTVSPFLYYHETILSFSLLLCSEAKKKTSKSSGIYRGSLNVKYLLNYATWKAIKSSTCTERL